MLDYVVLSRKYRPQTFSQVIGQEAIVTTLKNAIKNNRTAQAYLFCGMRGTGKTTLARVFAKALNCLHPIGDVEPCNVCASCTEITTGQSLDVIEIDGASNRGIEDVRKINDTISYAATVGRYKIYIIDEVHMLTKEAFNALLKTLEEPPAKAKFFFATTEMHKVPSTIQSRCQRFELSRIPQDSIVSKLQQIANDMHLSVELSVLELLAQMSEGALRDAESLFDQVIAFSDATITLQQVHRMLGVAPREWFFDLDVAMQTQDLTAAFQLSHQIFLQGKDLHYFLESLIQHLRNIAYIKVMGEQIKEEQLPVGYFTRYIESAKIYQLDQVLSLIDALLDMQQKFRTCVNKQIAIESILLQLIRSKQRIPIELLVQRLGALQKQIHDLQQKNQESFSTKIEVSAALRPATEKIEKQQVQVNPPPTAAASNITKEDPQNALRRQSRYDTLLQFAAVELEGQIKKEKKNN